MKTSTLVWMGLWGMGLVACDGGASLPLEQGERVSVPVATASASQPMQTTCQWVSVPPTPTVPARPVDLATYAWGTPLYPVGVASAFTVLVRDSTDASYFLAYGFDVARQNTVFFARGHVGRHDGLLNVQVAQDIAVAQPTMLPDFGVGGSGDFTVGPRPIGPQTHDWAWRLAFSHSAVIQGLREGRCIILQ